MEQICVFYTGKMVVYDQLLQVVLSEEFLLRQVYLASKKKIKDHLQPHQFGFACKQGNETIVHASRSFLEQHHNYKDVVLFKIDYKNAFNSVERDSILKEVKIHAPELYLFLWQCFHLPPFCFLEIKRFNRKLVLNKGIQQDLSFLAFQSIPSLNI